MRFDPTQHISPFRIDAWVYAGFDVFLAIVKSYVTH